MKKKKLTITEADYLLANRRASRLEEIQEHGHPVRLRRMIHKSKKAYDRNQSKRAAIKRDDSSFFSVNEILIQNALRVARIIPEWDVYYKLGEVHKQIYTLPINFNEKNRAKYSPNRTK